MVRGNYGNKTILQLKFLKDQQKINKKVSKATPMHLTSNNCKLALSACNLYRNWKNKEIYTEETGNT